jgi:hypothetical protein
MRFAPFVLFLAVFGATLSLGFADPQTAAQQKQVKKTGAPKKAVTGAKKGPASRSAPVSRKGTAGKKTVRRPVTAARQGAPSPDRYKEIQQALASKGYLKTEPTGVWDADSAAAMKQFQTDRKLDPSGKLTAAALIDLGLGPKSESAASPVAGPAASVSEPPKVETAPAPQPR